MKNSRRVAVYVAEIIVGVILFGLGCAEVLDAFWSGMGSAFLMVGILRLVRMYRFCKDENYREKVEVEMTDERIRFIRNKAWAWTGYLFIIIVGSSVIVLKLVGQETMSIAASYGVCLMLVLYWGSYLVLRKKY